MIKIKTGTGLSKNKWFIISLGKYGICIIEGKVTYIGKVWK